MRDTIDMAREAGGCEYGNANPDIESTFILKNDQIKAFEALVRADAIAGEREAIVSGYYGGQCVILPTDPARLFNSGTAFYTTPPAAPIKKGS